MKRLRSPMCVRLAALIAVVLFAQLPRTVGQNQDHPAQPAQVIQRQSPTSAPVSHAATPGQPQVPAPTVVLKPGEVPAITFKDPNYDFGRAGSGTAVEHVFEFTNTGTGPLEILLVKPDCGCTVAGEYNRVTQPGQSGKVPLKMTVAYGGHMDKKTTIYTNAPAPNATATLTMKGEVWEAVAYEPRAINFGRLTVEAARSEGLTRKVTITNNMASRADLTDVRIKNPLFKAEVKTLEPGKKFEVIVSIARPLERGNLGGFVEFQTGVPEAPKVTIPIYAQVVPDVEVAPKNVSLPVNRTGVTARQVTVRNNTKAPLKIGGLAVSNPAWKVTLTETQPGVLYTITLEVPAGSQLSAGGDKITFDTDCRTAPKVEVIVTEMGASPARPGLPGSATSKPASLPASPPAIELPAVKHVP
jgi:hypothetical protein